MVWYSLQSMVKNVLMRRSYPVHYYIDFLVSGKDAIRQMAMDAMPIINTRLLPVSADNNSADIPDDYVDWTKVGIRVGQYIKPLLERQGLNRLEVRDSAGQPTKYNGKTDIPSASNSGIGEPYLFGWDTVTWDSYGEYIGRAYGFSGAGSQSDTFKVIPERNKIQLDENYSIDAIVLEYISDGQSADAASKIEAYAVDTIEAYMIWQHKEQNRQYSLGERQIAKDEYIRQYQIYLARKNNLTTEQLRRLIYRNYRGSINT